MKSAQKNDSLAFELSFEETEVLIFALSILPEFELEETEAQALLNMQCCMSAISKLENHASKFTENETRVMIAAIIGVKQILSGEFTADAETTAQCQSHTFCINKLYTRFSSVLQG